MVSWGCIRIYLTTAQSLFILWLCLLTRATRHAPVFMALPLFTNGSCPLSERWTHYTTKSCFPCLWRVICSCLLWGSSLKCPCLCPAQALGRLDLLVSWSGTELLAQSLSYSGTSQTRTTSSVTTQTSNYQQNTTISLLAERQNQILLNHD